MDRAKPPQLDLGLGENVGRRIEASDYPAQDLSVFAAAYRLSVPVTVHVGNRLRHSARASQLRRRRAGRGQLSRFPDLRAHCGTAGRRRDAELRLGHHGAGGLSQGAGHGAQCRASGRARRSASSPPPCSISFRSRAIFIASCRRPIPAIISGPHKTILVRTVADGGESFYFCGDHRATFPALRRAVMESMTTAEILQRSAETLRAGGGRYLP